MKQLRPALMSLCLSLGCASSPSPPAPVIGAAAPPIDPTPLPIEAAEEPGIDEAMREQLHALLEEGSVAGTGGSLTVRLGEDVFSTTTGTELRDGPPITDKTLFCVQSVSKVVTAARVVELAHAGKLGLDDTIASHLPGVRLIEGEHDRAGDVTIRDLLMHRAGLPHIPPGLEQRLSPQDWGDPELLTRLTDDWTIDLVVSPGEYRYSNLGYVLLAAMVERVESCSFVDCMRGFLHDNGLEGIDGGPAPTFWPQELDAHAAHGRVVKEGGEEFLPPSWSTSRYSAPFGGLWTSTRALAAFGRRLGDASKDPGSPLFAMTQLDAEQGHGLGPVHRTRYGARALEHDGGGQGYVAWLSVIPEKDFVLAIAINGGIESKEDGQRLHETVENMMAVVFGEAAQRTTM